MGAAPLWAAGLALAAWWGGTGALMWAVARADAGGAEARRRLVVLAVPMLAAGVGAVIVTRGQVGPGPAAAAFLGALAVWAWIELAFLTGVVAGPSRDPGVPGPGRLRRAWAVVKHHEYALAFGLGVVAALHGPGVATWTYAILFAARVSAKLNLWLGVPRFDPRFLPRALAHVPSHFGPKRLNRLYPVSVALLTCGAIALGMAAEAGGPRAAGLALLAALTALAALEHWLMILPVRDDGLWRWATPAPQGSDE